MKVSGNHDFTASYRAVLLDLVPPFAIGIANGDVYYAAREVEIGDEGGLLSVTLDGVAQEVNLGKAHLVLAHKGTQILGDGQLSGGAEEEVQGVKLLTGLEDLLVLSPIH